MSGFGPHLEISYLTPREDFPSWTQPQRDTCPSRSSPGNGPQVFEVLAHRHSHAFTKSITYSPPQRCHATQSPGPPQCHSYPCCSPGGSSPRDGAENTSRGQQARDPPPPQCFSLTLAPVKKILESIRHCSWEQDLVIDLIWLVAQTLEPDDQADLPSVPTCQGT
jgi:hypothetical protein